jgi:hypothetical protein
MVTGGVRTRFRSDKAINTWNYQPPEPAALLVDPRTSTLRSETVIELELELALV